MIGIKVDECLPRDCAEFLARKGYDVETVQHEGLQGAPDIEVWNAAQREKRLLVTTDLDFSDARRYRPGEHAGVLLLRLSKEGKNHMVSYLEWLLAHHNIMEWEGLLVVGTDHKVRVRMAVA